MRFQITVLISALTAAAGPLSHADSGSPRPTAAAAAPDAPPRRRPLPPSAREALQSMLLKYAARCALDPSQSLPAAGAAGGAPRSFPGGLGLAPEWRDGTCDAHCQEKVSACLMALSNRTGRHVGLSVLSAAPAMSPGLRPSEADAPFPHQEGVFFGNVFSGQGYACRGRDAGKGEQVKRFCALDPASCAGLVPLESAGRCDDVCEMACSTLSDGTTRCAAASCRDPGGRVWRHPITTYLRNKIEAGNADRVRGLRRRDEGLERIDRGDAARFDRVDFGRRGAAPVSTLTLALSARRPGRVEVWLDGTQRLGALDVAPTGGVEQEQSVPLRAAGVVGKHSLVLKVVSGSDIGRLSTLELR